MLKGHLEHYHCFFALSNTPKRWISQEHELIALGWMPKINIEKDYGRPSSSLPFHNPSQSISIGAHSKAESKLSHSFQIGKGQDGTGKIKLYVLNYFYINLNNNARYHIICTVV